MPLDPVELQTVKFYDDEAAGWADQHSAFAQNFWESGMKSFQALLPPSPEVKLLEIGAGGGRDAKLLIEMGYDYTGTDVSAGLVQVAQQNNPTAKFFEQSVYDLDFPDSTFNGFWAVAVLLHIKRERLAEALANVIRVCRDGAIGFIAVKEGSGDVVESDDRGERLFVYYSQAEFAAALESAGLEILEFEYQPVSERTKWLKYLVQVHKE